MADVVKRQDEQIPQDMQIRWKDMGDGTYGLVAYVGDGSIVISSPIDDVSAAMTTISYPHHEVHEGSSFNSDAVDETMADDETIILAFKTMPGTKRAHMFFGFHTLVGGDLAVWEGATWTTSTGTLNPIINRKREASMNSSGLLEDKTATPTFTATNNILLNPTGLNTGSATKIHNPFAWGERKQLLAGGTREIEEYILKPDTQYAVVFTADGGSNKGQITLGWYEHTDSA
jgi:hypothetical protein